jgi:hypothetical protein
MRKGCPPLSLGDLLQKKRKEQSLGGRKNPHCIGYIPACRERESERADREPSSVKSVDIGISFLLDRAIL